MNFNEYQNEIDNFKNSLNNEKELKNAAQYIIENKLTMFFEVCCKFSHVTINADRVKESSYDVACVPKKDDVDNAINAAVSFIKNTTELHAEEILALINGYHAQAVFHDETKTKLGKLTDYNKNPMYAVLINFVEYPNEIWTKLYDEIMSKLKE